jgi:DNA-binding transcriptional LysR family regulator
MEEAESEVRKLQNEPYGILRVAVPKAFGTLYGGTIVSDFLAIHPKIDVSTIISASPINHAQMFEHSFDLAIRLSQPKDPLLITRQVCRFRWLVCASPEYVAIHGAPATPKDLSEVNCLIHTRLAADRVWRLSAGRRRFAIKVWGNFSSDSALVLRDGALLGNGIALLPAYCISEDLEQGRLVRILPEYSGPEEGLFIVFPTSKQIPKKVRLFVEFLVARFRTPRWLVKANG